MPTLVPIFVEAALGLGAAPEAAPELVEPSVAGVGHLAVGARPLRHLAVAVSTSFLRATYDNTAAPPADVAPDGRMTLTRFGGGVALDAIAPVGPVELSVGAAAHLYHTTESADGRLASGLPIEYAFHADTSLGFELEAGVSASPWPCTRGGARVFVSSHRAELAGDEVGLRVIGVELFVQADLAGSPVAAGGTATGCGVSSRRGR
jgi:hypothetical protein